MDEAALKELEWQQAVNKDSDTRTKSTIIPLQSSTRETVNQIYVYMGACPQKFGNLRKESANLVEELSIQEVMSTTKDEMVTSSNEDRMFTPSNIVQEDEDSTESVLISSGETVLMQTAKTDIRNPLTSVTQTVRILLDIGSHRSYITELLAKALNLKMGELTELHL